MAAFPRVDGYRGIWYTLGQPCEYGDKYSGGLGTYTAKHVPTAWHAAEAGKTFFVYGGSRGGETYLLNMVSYYDHERGVVPQPVVVHDKGGVDDPHDNSSISVTPDGHVWVFVAGRANARPGFKYRSVKPYEIDEFELVEEQKEMAYPQPWYLKGEGFCHLFTKYTGLRELYWSRSDEAGRVWTPHRKLAGIEGHYQTSRLRDGRIITAFNRHIGQAADGRTDLYFLQTDDMGETWRTLDGTAIDPPLTEADNPARVRAFSDEGLKVYMKDIDFDADGQPVVLVVTSRAFEPGPGGDPRTWTICHGTADGWRFHEVTRSTHNYDMGSLYCEADGTWRIIAPTEPGPQHWGTGGEMAVWTSSNRGETWTRLRQITRDSERNHAYARRPVNAHPDFYAFWADGNPDEHSPSYLYFTNRDGTNVRRLPYDMTDDFQTPESVE